MATRRWLVGLGWLCLLGACAAQPKSAMQPAPHSIPPGLPAFTAQLPALPTGKSTAIDFTSEVLGKYTYSRSANAIVDGTALQLLSPSNGLAWGIWEFVPGPRALHSVQCVLALEAGMQAYLALPDYSRGVWEFDGPVTAGKVLSLDNARHRSPAGNFYAAVITCGGNRATVYKHILTTQSPWLVMTPDADGNVGSYTSLALVNGLPAISYCENYYEGTGAGVLYLRATAAQGTAWGAPVVLHAGADLYNFTSLAVVNGKPAVSFSHTLIGGTLAGASLLYAGAADADGSAWAAVQDVDSDLLNHNYVGQYNSLVDVDGKPAISYYNAMYHALIYRRATDAAGTAWDAGAMLDTSGQPGHYTSLVIDQEGLPRISYYDAASGMLKGIGMHGNGTAWNAPFYIDAGPEDVGSFASGALVAGDLAVSYYNATDGELKYARYDYLAEMWVQQVIASAGNVGQHTSLALIGGKPAISYYDASNGDLKYVCALDAKGAAWAVPETVDSIGNVGTYTSLADIGGVAGISYYDEDRRDLKYAIRLGP